LLAKNLTVLCRGTEKAVPVYLDCWPKDSLFGVHHDWEFATRYLIQVLARFSDHCCFDPRDRIYALLGLVEAEERIPIDYNKPVHEVFLDVVMSFHDRHSGGRVNKHPCHSTLWQLAKNMGLSSDAEKTRSV